ncbi:hypothetical protein PIB30_098333, partial [Stylosanthes scabra]|nr:hypothetical protein [Stylosanthes scabra]
FHLGKDADEEQKSRKSSGLLFISPHRFCYSFCYFTNSIHRVEEVAETDFCEDVQSWFVCHVHSVAYPELFSSGPLAIVYVSEG